MNASVASARACGRQNGNVGGRRWQPFEAHIPFMLQLKIDFNLAGMGFLRLASVHFRAPLPSGARRATGWCDSPVVVSYEADNQGAPPARMPDLLGQDAMLHSGLGLPQPGACQFLRPAALWRPPRRRPVQEPGRRLLGVNPGALPAHLHSLSPFCWSLATIIACCAGRAGTALGGSGSDHEGGQLWTAASAPAEWLAPPGRRVLERQSVCELEADACVEDVLNRAEVRQLTEQQEPVAD